MKLRLGKGRREMIPPLLHWAFHQVQSPPQNSVKELCLSLHSNGWGNWALQGDWELWEMKGLI